MNKSPFNNKGLTDRGFEKFETGYIKYLSGAYDENNIILETTGRGGIIIKSVVDGGYEASSVKTKIRTLEDLDTFISFIK